MFEIKTTARTLFVEAAGIIEAFRFGRLLCIEGESLVNVAPSSQPFPFLIVEIKA